MATDAAPGDVLAVGIDSSAQSAKIPLARAADGAIVDQASAPHPEGTEVDPNAWWEALRRSPRRQHVRRGTSGTELREHRLAMDRSR